MSSLEEVPFKIPLGALGEVREEVELITAPDITLPDYLTILRDTEYEFTLENWVLRGLQGGYSTQPQAPVPCSPSDVLPSCPPYWMLFSSPQESRLASRWSSDLWEPNPRRRSRSLNASHLRDIDGHVRFTISDSDSDNDDENDGSSGGDRVKDFRSGAGSSQRFLNLPGRGGVPAVQSTPPKPQQQNLRRNMRQASLSAHTPRRPPTQRSLSLSGHSNQSPSNRSSVTAPKRSPAQIPSIKYTKPSLPSLCSYPRPPPSCGMGESLPTSGYGVGQSRPLGSHAVLDSSVELLSALSEEEKGLVEAITDHGYSLRTAIIALQKTREHSSEQILNYLLACDRLCELGYDETEVEEALEMFQNCETKAEEFLQLLNQFNEMGFQQHAIKEVLLVHENHRERALEELMTRVA